MTVEEIKKYTQRMPATIHDAAKQIAKSKKMSLNDFVISLVENEILQEQITPEDRFHDTIQKALVRNFIENPKLLDFIDENSSIAKKVRDELNKSKK